MTSTRPVSYVTRFIDSGTVAAYAAARSFPGPYVTKLFTEDDRKSLPSFIVSA